MNLIEQVIDLDGRATKGPWRADEPSNWHGLSGRVMNAECPVIAQFGLAGWKPRSRGVANMELVALYRTAAPKLARALQIALKPLKNFAAWEGDPMMRSGLVAPDRDDEARAVREILAEIEKELA